MMITRSRWEARRNRACQLALDNAHAPERARDHRWHGVESTFPLIQNCLHYFQIDIVVHFKLRVPVNAMNPGFDALGSKVQKEFFPPMGGDAYYMLAMGMMQL